MSVQRHQETMKISAKGQVVIPAMIRKKYGWRPGVQVIVEEEKPYKITLRIKPKKKTLAEKYRGSLKGIVPSTKKYLASKKEELKLEE